MADIRINSISSTASTTASDDYIAIDGSANGTRKLSAYSPTFGGNLTVSGTINPFVVGSGYTGFAGSVGILGGNGFFIQGKTGTTYDFAVGNNGGSVAFGVPAGTNNVEVLGNLTVSGGAITLLDPNVNLQADASNLRFDNYAGKGFLWSIGGSARLNLNNSGNLLLGTTTDSSNGKLQLATHTTSAGGIGFGTDIALYRSGPATAILETSIGGTGFRFDNGGAGSGNARLLATYGAMNIASNGPNSVFIQTNNTTALTLDSSQNATFAGSVRPEATPSSAWRLDFASGTGGGVPVSIAVNGTYDLPAGSGMVFVFDTNGGGMAQLASWFGATAIVWQGGSSYSTGAGTAGKINFFYNAGTGTYRFENKTAGAIALNIGSMRLRTTT